ncbi:MULTISPECIES: aspartate/glutamate racemase family protein [unclassified Streptomyces]|uniref:aspartate/glutamate racemase family protein n=1 Tax=unclassified Streptomyces TaxID=2593676 RepID=UPI0036EA61BD
MSGILVLNPNSSVSVTASMESCLAPVRAATRHSLRLTELAKSPPGIETDAHVAEVVPHILEEVGRAPEDIVVLSCFSDPGIDEVRRSTAKPVVGIAEAAYLTALGLGRRFGIVSLGPSSIDRHQRYLRRLGFDGRLAGDRSIDTTVVELMAGDVIDVVSRTATRLRDEDGAEVVILGCAGLGSYRAALQEALGIPVVDPVQAGVALACTQLDLACGTARRPRK